MSQMKTNLNNSVVSVNSETENIQRIEDEIEKNNFIN